MDIESQEIVNKGRRFNFDGSVMRWFDAKAIEDSEDGDDRVDWIRVVPFIIVHASVLAICVVGYSLTAVLFCLLFYALRMFAITGFYHRYFSHKSFSTNRLIQFLFAVVGNTAVQRGPIWWASHHRHHHRYPDEDEDAHSPTLKGILCSHLLWFMKERNFYTKKSYVKDWLKYPELILIDRFDVVIPILTALGIFGFGTYLESAFPALGTSGPQLLVWGFAVSTVILYHATFAVNSIAHLFGGRRFETKDESRNNFWLALITLGEGWHNNHHHYPISARQGFYWWEIDMTFYVLVLMEKVGMISNLRRVPQRVLDEGLRLPGSAEKGGL